MSACNKQEEISGLPVFSSNSYYMRFLAGQEPLEIFYVTGLIGDTKDSDILGDLVST